MRPRHDRTGLFLFSVYLLLYAGFVFLAAFRPELMESRPWVGLNLSLTYGFGLIAMAFVLALIYGWCDSPNQSKDSYTARKETSQEDRR